MCCQGCMDGMIVLVPIGTAVVDEVTTLTDQSFTRFNFMETVDKFLPGKTSTTMMRPYMMIAATLERVIGTQI